MNKSIPVCCIKCIGCFLAILFATTLVAEPLFDTHLHYNARETIKVTEGFLFNHFYCWL